MPLFFSEPLNQIVATQADVTPTSNSAPLGQVNVRQLTIADTLYIHTTNLIGTAMTLALGNTQLLKTTIQQDNQLKAIEINIPSLPTSQRPLRATFTAETGTLPTGKLNQLYLLKKQFELPDNHTFTRIERRTVERGSIRQYNLYNVLSKIPGTYKREISYTAHKLTPDILDGFETFRATHPVFTFSEDSSHFPKNVYRAVFQNVFASRWTTRYKGTGLSVDFSVVEV